ncbi:hypothetical protein [Photorhabdus namnaonensis]|nr:hypothetical protein [Photorhabdus namnaonensis]
MKSFSEFSINIKVSNTQRVKIVGQTKGAEAPKIGEIAIAEKADVMTS